MTVHCYGADGDFIPASLPDAQVAPAVVLLSEGGKVRCFVHTGPPADYREVSSAEATRLPVEKEGEA